MPIIHIAIWTKDLEKMKDFYIKYFNCKPGKNILIKKTHLNLIF